MIKLRYVFLTKDFYIDYSYLVEIEKKANRPYIMTLIRIDGIDFAIPLRSNINHPHVVWTDKPQKCGVDLSKAVIVPDPKYIDTTIEPRIRQNEFNALKGKKHFIHEKFTKYISDYKNALTKRHIHKEKDDLCKYSTLQNYHAELGIEQAQEIIDSALEEVAPTNQDT
jgi:protein AbiQ